MRQRSITDQAVHNVVGDPDEIIERDDGRTEYIGWWEGHNLLVVTEGDEEPLLVINAILRKRTSR